MGRRRSKILSIEQMRQREAVQPSVSGDPWRLPIEIHAFCLNEQTAIVTMPGEIFVELGLDLKKRSPFANTFVIEMANCNIYYVPTLRGFAQGDYEAMNSRLTPGSGERMVEEALQMLNEARSLQKKDYHPERNKIK
jgi:neutral ceramidase